jgi:hypothetical protein
MQVLLAKTVSKLMLGKLAKGSFKASEDGKRLPIISSITDDPLTLDPLNLCNLDIGIPNILKLSVDLNVP